MQQWQGMVMNTNNVAPVKALDPQFIVKLNSFSFTNPISVWNLDTLSSSFLYHFLIRWSTVDYRSPCTLCRLLGCVSE